MEKDTPTTSKSRDLRDELLDSRPGLRGRWDETAAKRAVALALVRLRKGAGRTQAELAKLAGWDKAFVSRLESATGPMPDTTTISRYVKACGKAASLVFADFQENTAHVVDVVPLELPKSLASSDIVALEPLESNVWEELRADVFRVRESPSVSIRALAMHGEIEGGGAHEGFVQAAKACLNLGIQLAQMRKVSDAVDAYKRAIKFGVESQQPEGLVQAAKASINLGVELGQMGKALEAIEAYQRAIELSLQSESLGPVERDLVAAE